MDELKSNEAEKKKNETNIIVIQAAPSTGVAAVLSFFVPGLGHLYLGNFSDGFLWFIFTIFCYFLFIIPGIFVHILCIGNALAYKPKALTKEEVAKAVSDNGFI